MAQAKMRELKGAARQLGVTSTTLRQHGWKTASPARVRAARDNPPDWLAAARERRQGKHQRRDRVSTAARLGIQPRAVRDRDIKPEEVGGMLAARPGWLIAEQERRQAQTARETADKLRRELADTLVTSVHEVWFQELKHAVTDAAAMLRQKGLAGARARRRGLSDSALGETRRQLAYKTGWYGSRLVVASRWYPSSKTCHACGHVQDIGWDELWTCAGCGAGHQGTSRKAGKQPRDGVPAR